MVDVEAPTCRILSNTSSYQANSHPDRRGKEAIAHAVCDGEGADASVDEAAALRRKSIFTEQQHA